MKILQNYVILNQLDLPTIEWSQFFESTELDEDLLWSIKVEKGTKTSEDMAKSTGKKSNSPLSFLRKRIKQKPECHAGESKENALIGVDADTAVKFGKKRVKYHFNDPSLVIYYPYYTVVKSGILDINAQRTVIEATNGDIKNLVKHNRVEVTLIFQEDDLQIVGNDKLFSQEEMLPLIDYSKEVKKSVVADLERGKSIQLYFSYMYRTSTTLKPVGDKKLIFYRFKIF